MSGSIELYTLTGAHTHAVLDLLNGQREDYRRHFVALPSAPAPLAAALATPGEDVYLGVWWGEMLMGVVTLRDEEDMPVLDMMVDEAYAGTGIADAAIRLALCTARYRGAQRVRVECETDNRRARRCFLRHGFQHAGDAPDGRLRLDAIIAGVHEAETDLRTLYDPDIATVQRGIRAEYGMDVTERFARDFAAFAQAKAGELV